MPRETLQFGAPVYGLPEVAIGGMQKFSMTNMSLRRQRLNIHASRISLFQLQTAFHFICLLIPIKLYPNWNLLPLGAKVKSTRAAAEATGVNDCSLLPSAVLVPSIKRCVCKRARARPIRPAPLPRHICSRGRRWDVAGAELAPRRPSVILD